MTWIPRLATTAEDECHARQMLLTLLARHDSLATTGASAPAPSSSLGRLDPTLGDISNWHDWAAAPDSHLLAAVRRNAPISAWLAALRSFPD